MVLMGPKSSLLTDIQRQSIDYCSQVKHSKQAFEMHVKHLLAVFKFSSEIMGNSFQLCFRVIAFSDKSAKMQEFRMLKLPMNSLTRNNIFPVVSISPKLNLLMIGLFANKTLSCSGH